MLQKYINSKKKASEIKDFTLRLGNISKHFTINNMKKTGLNFFSVDFNLIVTSDILNVYRCLMKRYLMKILWIRILTFRLIKKMFRGLLISIVNASNNTKYVSLSNQKYMTQATLFNLHLNEYSQQI